MPNFIKIAVPQKDLNQKLKIERANQTTKSSNPYAKLLMVSTSRVFNMINEPDDKNRKCGIINECNSPASNRFDTMSETDYSPNELRTRLIS